MLRQLAQRFYGKKSPSAKTAIRKQKAKIALAGRSLPIPMKTKVTHKDAVVFSVQKTTTSRMLPLLTAAGSLMSVANAATFTFISKKDNHSCQLVADNKNDIEWITRTLLEGVYCGVIMPGGDIGKEKVADNIQCYGARSSGIDIFSLTANFPSSDIWCLRDKLDEMCFMIKREWDMVIYFSLIMGVTFLLNRFQVPRNAREQQQLPAERDAIVPPEMKEAAVVPELKDEAITYSNDSRYLDLQARFEKIQEHIQAIESKDEQTEIGAIHYLLPGAQNLLKLIADELTCGLNYNVFQQPVSMASGMNYEKTEIERWFQQKYTCPMTGMELPANLPPQNKKMIACVNTLLPECERMIVQMEQELQARKDSIATPNTFRR